MGLSDLALAHIEANRRVAKRAIAEALRVWEEADARDLDLWWATVAPGLVRSLERAQLDVAAAAPSYVTAITSETPPVASQAFVGVALDGREVGPGMFGAVTKAKEVIGTGRPLREAFHVGAMFLATYVSSAVLDMGRQADLVGGVATRHTHYVRVLSPGACSRCAVLAGKSSGATPFKRHPRCHCGVMLVRSARSKVPDGLFDSPVAYFDSLSAAEQDRIFTNAGAEAIRQGGSVTQVVNARRGASGIGYASQGNVPSVNPGHLKPVTIGRRPDGSPLQVFATTEGTTARGGLSNYQRSASVRLMPEQIAIMAGRDTDRWIELLRRYGYLY